MNREELDKFVGAVIGKGCSINTLLNINLKHNNMFKDENLIYVLNGLIKGSGAEVSTIKKESLDMLKETGMLSDDFYNKLNNSMTDGVIKLEAVLELESSTELTMEQKMQQAEAIKSLDKVKYNDATQQDLNNLSALVNEESGKVDEDLKAKAKSVLDQKADEARNQAPELMTNSITNIETYQNLLRPIAPKFTDLPNITEASTLIENAILEGQLSLGAASQILAEVGFNPAEVTDLLRSSTSPSPEFNADDVSVSQATAGERLAETLSILGDEQTTLMLEQDPSLTVNSQEDPRITMVKNYINNSLITFDEIKNLQENGQLELNEEELESIEKMEIVDESSAESTAEQPTESTGSDLEPTDLQRFLEFIDLEMEKQDSAERVMTKPSAFN